ncbi:hypothetical protein K2Y00_04175 [Patescibacteria group bacterium]|nr:hypothetical protein [Patescibacteria group bacterium]
MSPVSSGLPVDPDATLSKYLPKGAAYFYGFPAGKGSDFYNNVPPWVEELVSARTMVCAGPSVQPVVFAAASSPEIREWLSEDCGIALPEQDACIQIPPTITDELTGNERDAAVRSVLESECEDESLFMAQPFLDPSLSHLFSLNPKLSAQFNDKTYLTSYIPARYLPARHGSYANGVEFLTAPLPPIPCVVKVGSSSAGDGVRICRTEEDFSKAKESFKDVREGIFIEEFIDMVANYGVQFGIPHDPTAPIEIIGYNHQVITDFGEFLGSVVCPPHVISNPALHDIFSVLTNIILPRVRAAGWYGVGGLDVLLASSGKFYFIDPNFRQTAAFGLVSLSRRGLIQKKAVGFIGTFTGSEQAFKKLLSHASPKTPHQMLQMISMSKKGDLYRFNAGLLFENHEELAENARRLHDMGVEGKVIDLILEGYELRF